MARVRPDLIVSTYPLGSAGLAWSRRHRALLWLSETVRGGAPAILGEIVAQVTLVVGVVVLSRRAPQVAAQDARSSSRWRRAPHEPADEVRA